MKLFLKKNPNNHNRKIRLQVKNHKKLQSKVHKRIRNRKVNNLKVNSHKNHKPTINNKWMLR